MSAYLCAAPAPPHLAPITLYPKNISPTGQHAYTAAAAAAGRGQQDHRLALL
jgi:hypothetical protein